MNMSSGNPLFSPLFNALASMHSVPAMLDTTGGQFTPSFVMEQGTFDITSYPPFDTPIYGLRQQNASQQPRSFLDNIRSALQRFN